MQVRFDITATSHRNGSFDEIAAQRQAIIDAMAKLGIQAHIKTSEPLHELVVPKTFSCFTAAANSYLYDLSFKLAEDLAKIKNDADALARIAQYFRAFRRAANGNSAKWNKSGMSDTEPREMIWNFAIEAAAHFGFEKSVVEEAWRLSNED